MNLTSEANQLPSDFFTNKEAFVKGETAKHVSCEMCYKLIITTWWYGKYYKLVCDNCGAIYDVGRKWEEGEYGYVQEYQSKKAAITDLEQFIHLAPQDPFCSRRGCSGAFQVSPVYSVVQCTGG